MTALRTSARVRSVCDRSRTSPGGTSTDPRPGQIRVRRGSLKFSNYRVWIAEYAGAPYQEVAARAQAHLDRLADLYATPAREAELVAIFKEAARLETNFWQMAWLKGQSIE